MGLKLTGKRRRDDDDDAPASARNWDKTNEAHQCTNRYRDLYLAERPRTAHEKSALLLRLSTQHDDDEADNQPKQKKMRRGEAGAPIRNFPRPQAVSRYEPHKWFFAELMRQINGRATEEEDHLRITTLSWLRDHLRPADFEGLGLNQCVYIA
ncbi:hypothetical protein PVAG01_00690 [Phlyctema vagabunda]|uniref:Uncharacterized protein n=1 Tax=Phlyctema vagabunda TaxID=108571 RepID=A0ABR4PVA6_9HELO